MQKATSIRERISSERANLGFTAALEHYTATLAELILTDPEARAQIGHDGVRYLLMWHALEEAEHKAVAFDVYKQMGGTERMRVTTMWLTHVTFVLETSTWTVISLAMDPAARRHPLRVLRSCGGCGDHRSPPRARCANSFSTTAATFIRTTATPPS